MKSIIHYIIHIHHVNTRFLLERMEKEIDRSIMQEHGHSGMQVVQKNFMEFAVKLEAHMREEEKEIFPFLIFAEGVLKKGIELSKVLPPSRAFQDSVRDVLFEHRFMDRGFEQMEKLVGLFQQNGLQKGLDVIERAMKELEKDNQKHIHLENDFLLKKAALLGLMD